MTQRGFTIFEALIALFIFSYCLLAVAFLQRQAQQYQLASWQDAKQTIVIANLLEQVEVAMNSVDSDCDHSNCYGDNKTGCISSLASCLQANRSS